MTGRGSFRLYAHLTWHTWRRVPQLREYDVPILVDSVLDAATRTGVTVHAQAALTEHVHLLVSCPPHVPLASFVREAKSESSRRINSARLDAQRLRWCRGYYAGSVCRNHVAAVRSYIARQFHRHPDRIPH